jgi:hypothetical protein
MFVLVLGALGAQEKQNPFLNIHWVVEIVGSNEPMAFCFYPDGTYKQSDSLRYEDLQNSAPMRYRIDLDKKLIELEVQQDFWVEWRYEFGIDGQRYFNLYLSNAENPLAQQFFGEFEQSVEDDDSNEITQEFFSAISDAMKDVILKQPFMRGFEPAG